MITHTPNSVNGHFFALQLSDMPYTNNQELFCRKPDNLPVSHFGELGPMGKPL